MGTALVSGYLICTPLSAHASSSPFPPFSIVSSTHVLCPVFAVRPSVSLSWVLLTGQFLLVFAPGSAPFGSPNPSLENCLHKHPSQEGSLRCPGPTSCPATSHLPPPKGSSVGSSVSHSGRFSARSPGPLVQVPHLPHLCQVKGHLPQMSLGRRGRGAVTVLHRERQLGS